MAKLVNNEKSPFTDVITFTSAELAAIGGSTKVIARIPPGGALEFCVIATGETFAVGATVTAPTGNLSIGDGTTAALFSLAALPPSTATTAAQYNTGSGFTSAATKPIGIATTGTNVVLTVVAGNYSSLDAGKIVIGLRIIDPLSNLL
jgi:hypothetical protein